MQTASSPTRYPSYTSSKLQLGTLQHPTRENYSAITAYGASKLCNLLFMLEFHCHYGESGISCMAVHPGNLLPTNLTKNAGCMYRAAFTFLRPFTRSVVRARSTFCTYVLGVVNQLRLRSPKKSVTCKVIDCNVCFSTMNYITVHYFFVLSYYYYDGQSYICSHTKSLKKFQQMQKTVSCMCKLISSSLSGPSTCHSMSFSGV